MFSGYETKDDGSKEEVYRLENAEPRNSFTPIFFYFMERILKRFNMDGTVSAILESLDSYEDIRTLSLKSKDDKGAKYSELIFGPKFLAFLHWAMEAASTPPTAVKGGYVGNDAGKRFNKLIERYKVKVTYEDGEVIYPWVEAFHDEWIGVLNGLKDKKPVAAIDKNGMDADDLVIVVEKGGPPKILTQKSPEASPTKTPPTPPVSHGRCQPRSQPPSRGAGGAARSSDDDEEKSGSESGD